MPITSKCVVKSGTNDGSLPDKTDQQTQLVTWSIGVADFSQWFTNEVLGIFEGTAPTVPTTLYVAARSTASTKAAPGTELVGNGYARTVITFTRVSDIKRWNPTAVVFPDATDAWSILSFTLHDSATSGNYYAYGNLGSTLAVMSGAAVSIAENGAVLSG